MTTRPTDDHYHNLLIQNLSEDEIAGLLAPVGFADWQGATTCLQRIARVSEASSLFAESLPTLLLALSEAARPDHVLVSLERFVRNVPDRPALFHHFINNPRAVELLVTLLAGSQFLTEILLRNPEYLTQLTEHQNLSEQQETAEFYQKAQALIPPIFNDQSVTEEAISPTAIAQALDALRSFQRWQLLKLGTCDLLGLLDMPTVTLQLSNLADSLIRICLNMAIKQSKTSAHELVIFGMGKLGGRELNYSSDIDLLFLSATEGSAYRSLGQHLIKNLTQATKEGFLYRVDMRLRPWGRTGPLVSSLAAYISYLNQHAQLWEKQALLKARVVAGDEALGRRALQQITPLLFGTPAQTIQADVRTMKERIEAQLSKRGRKWGEVKLGEGSIRDIEFVAQYLQLIHGQTTPQIRSPNTLEALNHLLRFDILLPDEHRTLTTGYTFLRSVEHYLQMMHYRQTHTLPDDPEALENLARRLGFRGSEAGVEFIDRYQQHISAIRVIYRKYLENVAPKTAEVYNIAPLANHLASMSGSYAETFSETEIKRHMDLMSRLNDDNLVEVEAIPLDDERWQITIVGYDHLGVFSLICGLMYIHRLNILDGQAFTSQVLDDAVGKLAQQGKSSKIVDVFTVIPVASEDEAGDHKAQLLASTPSPAGETIWTRYRDDLHNLMQRVKAGERAEVRRDVVSRFADTMRKANETTAPTLYPIDIHIDIETDERYTILRIDTPDTIGFLYEFANALALSGFYIAKVTIQTIGARIQDILYVTDTQRRKITSGQKLFELRSATVLVKHFTHLLPHAPNPTAALIHFREFLGQLFTLPDWPNEIATLIRPEVLDALARLLGVSDFLWNDFLRMQHTNLFPVIRDIKTLAQSKTKSRLEIELDAILQFAPDVTAQRQLLNEFKDREMFRIDMRHILGHIPEYSQFGDELSDLAEVVIAAAYNLCYQDLRKQFGDPRQADGQLCPMTVCALGKFGGRELGFASDIELMFIFNGSGQTTGPKVLRANLFYERLVQAVQATIQTKREGIFELDLQLRPYGKAGSMAVSLPAFRRYFAADGGAWDYERQALVKLRPVAGDPEFGDQVAALRDELIYTGHPFNVATMRGMRERQVRHSVTAGAINAKYSPGAVVDIEYLVQGLQITHGQADPTLRVTGTRKGLTALYEAKLLSQTDYEGLYQAYNFLRRVINALRMVRGNAKDLTIPPPNSEEFAFLARRLHYSDNLLQLQQDLTAHTAFVQECNTRLLNELND